MTEKLKPCPFCGYPAIDAGQIDSQGTLEICCSHCGAMIRELDYKQLVDEWNRRAQQPNEPLTLEQLQQMDEERVWTQFRGLGMYGLVAYRSDPDGDDGDNVYITNNLGGRDTFEEILDQGGTVYARKPEAGEKG